MICTSLTDLTALLTVPSAREETPKLAVVQRGNWNTLGAQVRPAAAEAWADLTSRVYEYAPWEICAE